MSQSRLQELTSGRPLLSDGAMGTMLQKQGLQPGACPELLNAEHPDIVRSVHLAYIEAGSRMIGTNTFGGTRAKLQSYGLADRVQELNAAGIRIAREAAGDDILVAGSVGPTGDFLEPLGDLTFEAAVGIYEEQAAAMADAGADCILIETFADLVEAKAALAGALKTGLPVLCTMPFDTNGHTMMGVDPVTAARELSAAGASGVGSNCGVGPAEMLDIMTLMRPATTALLVAQPNAGKPRVVQGETIYDSTPDEMALYAVTYAQAGVDIIGGCCGSTPEHIRAMASALKAL